jgi:glutaredoxin-like YruB-family protein
MKINTMMIKVNSFQDFKEKTSNRDNYWLLLHKSDSKQSICANQNISDALTKSDKEINVFTADVNNVKDIHQEYSVTSVPTLLKFEKSNYKGIYKGCNNTDFYNALFTNSFFTVSNTDSDAVQKSVTVYSTPTCSWCNRLKTYLRENNIRFRDIDVSKDQKAAEDMVKRSGQQGVPQSLIGGQVIVGFDKTKIDKLLGL